MHVTPHHKVHFEQFFFKMLHSLLISFSLHITGCPVEQFFGKKSTWSLVPCPSLCIPLHLTPHHRMRFGTPFLRWMPRQGRSVTRWGSKNFSFEGIIVSFWLHDTPHFACVPFMQRCIMCVHFVGERFPIHVHFHHNQTCHGGVPSRG